MLAAAMFMWQDSFKSASRAAAAESVAEFGSAANAPSYSRMASVKPSRVVGSKRRPSTVLKTTSASALRRCATEVVASGAETWVFEGRASAELLLAFGAALLPSSSESESLFKEAHLS
jgi:fatty acid/phospholipid biosynthesis enzyme